MRLAQPVTHHLDVRAQIIEICRIGGRYSHPVKLLFDPVEARALRRGIAFAAPHGVFREPQLAIPAVGVAAHAPAIENRKVAKNRNGDDQQRDRDDDEAIDPYHQYATSAKPPIIFPCATQS